jgi:hypothetical protein
MSRTGPGVERSSTVCRRAGISMSAKCRMNADGLPRVTRIWSMFLAPRTLPCMNVLMAIVVKEL